MSFSHFSLHDKIMAGISNAGYTVPTPIQRQAIPIVLEGRDVVGLAQTGTGKTAAFALPILQRLLEEKQFARMNAVQTPPRRGPRQGNIPLTPIRALVLAPTRELARQIYESFVQLGGPSGCRATAIYGGVGMHPQISALRRGVDVVVACPGRLLDLMNQGYVDLSSVQVLVLDEADHMFDMGFLPDVRRILRAVPTQRQTLLFSATMPPEIQQLADEVLTDPQRIALANTRPAATVSQGAYQVAADRKADLLEALLGTGEVTSAIVFTRTKHRAKSLAGRLERKGHKATSLQGNLSQNQRERAMSGFRNGHFTIMVATDIAARGLDCEGVSHVINFDLPDTVECYTHRVGRTGRAEKSGRALTLVGREDQSMLRAIERSLGIRLERCTLEGFDMFAPAEPSDEPLGYSPRNPRGQRPGGRAGGRLGAGHHSPVGHHGVGAFQRQQESRTGESRTGESRAGGQRGSRHGIAAGSGAEPQVFGLRQDGPRLEKGSGRPHGSGGFNGGMAAKAAGKNHPAGRPAFAKGGASLAFQPKASAGLVFQPKAGAASALHPAGDAPQQADGHQARRPRRRAGHKGAHAAAQ